MAKTTDFSMIRHIDGSFLADNIPFDLEETIKVYGEDGTLIGLLFSVLGERTCINEYQKKKKAQMGHFHIVPTKWVKVSSLWLHSRSLE